MLYEQTLLEFGAMVECTETGTALQICLRPNRSATWQQTVVVVAALGGLALFVGIMWAIRGAWVILPFAGLEVLLLAYFLYRVSTTTYRQEVVYIEPNQIRLEGGVSHPLWCQQFAREDSEFVITRPRHSLSPAEITIHSPQGSFRVGAFLNQDDTTKLTEYIRSSGTHYRVIGKTHIVAIDGFRL